MTGLPLTTAAVAVLPWLLATTRVLPLALGVGVGLTGMVMMRLEPSMRAFMVLGLSVVGLVWWLVRQIYEQQPQQGASSQRPLGFR